MVVNIENSNSFDTFEEVNRMLAKLSGSEAKKLPLTETDEVVDTPFFTEMASLGNQIMRLDSDNIKYERERDEYTKWVDYGGKFTYYGNTLSYSAHEDGDQKNPDLTFKGKYDKNPSNISLDKFNEQLEIIKDLVKKEESKQKPTSKQKPQGQGVSYDDYYKSLVK